MEKRVGKQLRKMFAVALSTALVMGAVVNEKMNVSADEAVTYVPGVVYTMDENELAAKGEAPEGYTWDVVEVSAHVDGYYDTNTVLCEKTEHTHASATEADCQGYVLTCTAAEHTHSGVNGNCYAMTCTQEEHEHFFCGYNIFTGKYFCGKDEHEHTNACYSMICTETEHTHSAYGGSCYTANVCEAEEHVHTTEAGCYAYVEPVLAVYKAQLIKDGSNSAANGNQAITIKVNVTCADGTPANGVKVSLTAEDWDPLYVAETPVLTKEATTGLNGVVTFQISGTYDQINSVIVNGTNLISSPQFISYIVSEKSYSYQLSEHNYVLDETTVVEATLTEDGYTGDSVCAHCGDVKAGEVVPKNGVTVTYTGIKNGEDTSNVVAIGSNFVELTVPEVKHTHQISSGKYVVKTTTFEGWTLDGQPITAADVVNTDITVVANYSDSVVADTDVLFFMLKAGVTKPEGTVPSSDSNFTPMGSATIAENATVTADQALVESYFTADTLNTMLSSYTKTANVGGMEVVYEQAEVFRTMYITGNGNNGGWHADCYIVDIMGDILGAESWSYVFFCDENGNVLTDANGDMVVKRVITGSLLTDVYAGPEKEADETYTYSFAGWTDNGTVYDFANDTVDVEILVVCASYDATEKPAPSESPAPVEPTTTPAPAEPTTTPAPAEPTTTPAPAEPTTTPAPAEPTVTPAPAEPTATPAPVVPATTPAPAVNAGNVVVIEDEDTPLADAAVLGASRGMPSAQYSDDAAVLGADRKPGTGDDSGIWTVGFLASLVCLAAWVAVNRKTK